MELERLVCVPLKNEESLSLVFVVVGRERESFVVLSGVVCQGGGESGCIKGFGVWSVRTFETGTGAAASYLCEDGPGKENEQDSPKSAMVMCR